MACRHEAHFEAVDDTPLAAEVVDDEPVELEEPDEPPGLAGDPLDAVPPEPDPEPVSLLEPLLEDSEPPLDEPAVRESAVADPFMAAELLEPSLRLSVL